MKDSLLLLGCIAFILVDHSLAVRRMRRSAPAVLQNPAQISKDFVQLQTNTNQDNNNSDKSDGMDGNLQMNPNNDDQMSNLDQNKNNCAPRDTEMGVSGGGGSGNDNGGNSNLEPGLQDSNNHLLNILNLKNKKDTFNNKFPKQNDLNNQQQQQPQQQQQQDQMQQQMAVNGNNNVVAAQSPQIVGSGESDVNELKQTDVCMAAENGNGNGGAQLMNSQALEGEMPADESEMPSKDFDTANVRDGHPRILLHNLKNSKLAKLTNKGGSGSGGGSNNYKNLLTQARVNHNGNNNNNNGNRNNFTPNLKNNNGNKVAGGNNNNNNAGFTNNNNNNNNNDNGVFNNNNDNSNSNNGNRNNNNNFNSNEGRPNSPNNNNNNNNNKNNNDNNNNNNMASNSNANNNVKNNAGSKINSAVNANKVVGNNNNKNNNNNPRVNDADRNNNNNKNDNNDNIDFNNLGRNGNAGSNSQFNKNSNNKINNNDNNSGTGSKSSNSDYNNNNNNNAGSGSGSAGKNLLTNDNLNYIIKGATNKNMIVNKNNAGQNNKANRIVTNLENANRQSDYISDMKNLIFNDSFISYPVKVIYGNGMESSPKLEEHDNNDLLLKQQPLKNFALSGNSNSLNSLSNFNSINNLNAGLSNPLSNLNQMNNNNNNNMHSNNVKFSSGIKKMEEDMDLKTPVVPQRAPWQGPGGEQLMQQSQPVRKDKFSPVESVLKFANMLLYKVGLSDNKSYRPSATQVYVNPGTNPGSPGSLSDNNDDFDSIDYLYNSLGDNSASGTTRSAVISPSGSISVPLMPPFVFQPPMTQTDAATLPFNFLENALDSLLSTSANAEDDSGDDDFELRCPVHRESNKEKRNSSAANPNDIFQVCSCRLYKKKRSPKE